MAPAKSVTITSESYLEPLGLSKLRERVDTPEQQQQLYELIAEFLSEKDAVSTPVASDDPTELPFKVPGLPLHIRLSSPTKDELTTFAGIAALVIGAASANVVGLTVGAVLAVASRVQRLKSQYGETCVVESVAESAPPTSREITLTLFGKKCRRPTAGCRFHEVASDTCAMGPDAVASTLVALTDRKVVKSLNVVEPIEYGVVV